MAAEREPVHIEPEILDIQKYGGLYGRFLLASQSNPESLGNILSPQKDIPNPQPAIADPTSPREYSKITINLSTKERKKAWEGISYQEAMTKWKSNFAKNVTSITDEKRKEAFGAIIPGKELKDFTADDAQALYDKFCKDNNSDTGEFIQSVVKNLKDNGELTRERIEPLVEHIQWFAGQMFGANTAEAVSRMVELEVEIRTNTSIVPQLLYSDDRINKLESHEKELLTLLSEEMQVDPDTKQPDLTVVNKTPGDDAQQPSDTTVFTESAVEKARKTVSHALSGVVGTIKDLAHPKAQTGDQPQNVINNANPTPQEPSQPEQADLPADTDSQQPKTQNAVISEGDTVSNEGEEYIVFDETDDLYILKPKNAGPTITMKKSDVNEIGTEKSPWKIVSRTSNAEEVPTSQEDEETIIFGAPITEANLNSNPDSDRVESNEEIKTEKDSYSDLLKDKLRQETGDESTQAVQFESVRNDLFSLVGEIVDGGEIEYFIPQKSIAVRKLKLKDQNVRNKLTITFDVQLDVVMSNTRNNGIKFDIDDFKGDDMGKGTASNKIKTLPSSFKKLLSESVSDESSQWKATRIVIDGTDLKISFTRSKSSS